MATDLRNALVATAQSLGIDPLDLATAISYETAGTFDPMKRGPTTKWGQHRGLIQFGEPQAKQYGVNWEDPIGSQLGPDGAVAKYLKDTGVKPGMGLMDVYSAINAGGVGRNNRSDAHAGGAPGTVADKVNNQMAGHRAKAEKLLAGVDLGSFGSMAPPQASAAPAQAPAPQTAQGAPAAVQRLTSGGAPAVGASDIFGMLAAMPQQQPQMAAPPIQGPSPQQANGLLQLVQALKTRMA